MLLCKINIYWRLIKQVLIGSLLFLFVFVGRIDQALAQKIIVPGTGWPPKGKRVSCPVIRDTWVSAAEGEKLGNNGGSGKLKLKGRQEFFLFDIDADFLKGKKITGALLHVNSASPRTASFARIGVSSLASPWSEGKSERYKKEKGAACYAQAELGKRGWAYPGSTIMDVTFGRGHTRWKFADCSRPDKDGWQACAVDPDVVSQKTAGLSYGFVVMDEVGSTWSIENKQFKYNTYPNRYCHSRENAKKAPWLEVWYEECDLIPPDPIQAIIVERSDSSRDYDLLKWKTPEDKGCGRTIGFKVHFAHNGIKSEFPHYRIPLAEGVGQEVLMQIGDVGLNQGDEMEVIISPVDNSGNVGTPCSKVLKVPFHKNSINLPVHSYENRTTWTDNPPLKLGNLRISVVDLLDKIDPVTGAMIPVQKRGYKNENHIFSSKNGKIKLFGAKNEDIFFQLNLEGTAENIQIYYEFQNEPLIQPEFFEFAYVKKQKGISRRVYPDPLIPLKGKTFSIPSDSGKIKITHQGNHSLVCRIYIPHEIGAGIKNGTIRIRHGKQTTDLPVELTVWNFTLPDKLSFIPEMNAYGKTIPLDTYEHYRVAHRHRTCLNRLPYGWKGRPYIAPAVKNDEFRWDEWDKLVAPLLDGRAFKDLPRAGRPVDVFYLPFTENWPVNIYEYYSPSYWADEAFDLEYGDKLKSFFGRFASHCNDRNWHETLFQFYLNNKVYYRKKEPESSAPWVFDEPMNIQDFWALRWYGTLWKSAVGQVKGKSKMWFRADISYTQFKRDLLKGIMDVEYIGGNNLQKIRMKEFEKNFWGPSYYWEYGTANDIEDSNVQPAAWCISAWRNGADGVLPWQTIGNRTSWEEADQTALIYPHESGPKASVRLKAFTRGQQDVEYYTLYCKAFKKGRKEFSDWLGRRLKLGAGLERMSGEDAGTISFNYLKPVDLWRIRTAIGKRLSDKAPDHKEVFVDFKTGKWYPEYGATPFYVHPSPRIQPMKPECDSFGEIK